MKKVMFIAFLSIGMFLTAKSQKVYVQGGVNLANISNSSSGATQDNKMLVSFNAGILARFGISEIFDVETGLVLDGRGSKANTFFGNGTDDNYIKTKFNPFYLELPLHAVVKLPLADKANVFIFAGPYVAMGMFGKYTVKTNLLGNESTTSGDIKFDNDDPFTSEQEGAAYNKIKKFDYGVNGGVGVDLGSMMIKAKYGLGMAKINSMESDDQKNDKNKYRTLSISLGIPLGR